MKILITGANGFLGKEFAHHFKEHNVVLLSRHHAPYVDLLRQDSLKDFFLQNNKFDFVFHTAICGATKDSQDNVNVLKNNLLMFENLLKYNDCFGYLFNFCSGAALRDATGIVDMAKEEEIFKITPIDQYGLSKNLIARKIQEKQNMFNFRLFGCSGEREQETRFIKNIVNNLKNNIKPTIHQNKYMDFISIKDVVNVMKYYIGNPDIESLPRDINLVYDKKTTLLEIYETIKTLTKVEIGCNILDENQGKSYTGDPQKLANLGIKLEGLESYLSELV